MRKVLLILALALAAAPAGALAAKPTHPTHPTHPATPSSTASSTANGKSAKVQFVVRGTVVGYVAASGTTNGWISLTVKSSNFESTALKAAPQPVVFTVSAATKIVLHDGKAIAGGDTATVKIRAAKNAAVATLQAAAASQVVDQG
jgi:hypothetical protein